MLKLPRNICCLDIETAKTFFKNPEKTELAIAGIKFYSLLKGRYKPINYQYFTNDNIKSLEHILKKFSGIIIGHNIFGFDYRVLHNFINLSSIIEKTVDTQALLYKKCCVIKGLSLEGLCYFNFGRGKTIEGKQVMHLWRKGNYKKVIDYNQNDCILTKMLWWNIVSKRKLNVVQVFTNKYAPELQPRYYRAQLQFTDTEIKEYLCQRRITKYSDWLHKRGNYIEIKKDKIVGTGDPKDALPEHVAKCPKCKSNSLDKLDLEETIKFYGHKMTDGQESDYYAGVRGVAHCQKCGYSFDY